MFSVVVMHAGGGTETLHVHPEQVESCARQYGLDEYAAAHMVVKRKFPEVRVLAVTRCPT